MQITVDVPGDFAAELADVGPSELSEILSLGINEWHFRGRPEFAGLGGLLERLAKLPEPEDVLSLRPSSELAARASELLEQSRTRALSADEQMEWQRLELVEHLVRIAKAQAALKLQRT
jgi:hypothetical protein